jgi:hypothetical protein
LVVSEIVDGTVTFEKVSVLNAVPETPGAPPVPSVPPPPPELTFCVIVSVPDVVPLSALVNDKLGPLPPPAPATPNPPFPAVSDWVTDTGAPALPFPETEPRTGTAPTPPK